ncbi:ABC transporter ATP-binding protein [Streptomyces sp. NPDC048182]|uniref:ABC transporter ATP-binding protein n=1 Tax=unclassified Streptomyces TaxID=2593676 RepID=UPI0033BED35F
MGIEVVVEGLTKSFGRQSIWQDVSLTLPAGEVSVMLGPSGTGKTVFLKSLIGLLKPERGRVLINGVDMVNSPERDIYETRKLFGLMFQDGALFGSMSLFDNIAFPLREHTRKKESEIRRIVMERIEVVGLLGAEGKLPGEISGGMRKRAGLARALVLDPQIILCDEPDSGLDPVRTAYLSQLLIDLNAQIDATMLIVTHNLDIAATVPDNMGMLFRRELVTFGPREVLLTSEEPVVAQFLAGRRQGPIGMSEEKDAATLAAEAAGPRPASADAPRTIVPQLEPSPGLPPRQAVTRRRERVLGMLDRLPPAARRAIEHTYATAPTRPLPVAGGAGGTLPGRPGAGSGV